jgi:hypothetical protein
MDEHQRLNDSEDDYEILAVDPGHRVGGIVSVRLNPDEMDVLIALSQTAGRTMSETLRIGLRALANEPATATNVAPARPATRGAAPILRLTTNADSWAQSNA